MRLNGVEPSRPVRDTRPSTLRVYQFRHSRSRAADSRCSRPGAQMPCKHPNEQVACEQVFELTDARLAGRLRRICWWIWT